MKQELKDLISIMSFLGFEYVRIGYYGTDDATTWQVENEDWIEEMEIESTGNYFVDVPNNDFYCLGSGIAGQKRLKEDSFKKDWNLLMKLITKLLETEKDINIVPHIETMYLVCLTRINQLKTP